MSINYAYISGFVGGWNATAGTLREVIQSFRAEDPAAPVTVIINSEGGDVYEGIAIYNLLQASKVDVVISGMAASIASVIAMAGRKVSMYANSILFVHHAWTCGEGNAAQLEQQVADLKAADASLISAYMAKSGRTEQEIVGLLDGPNGEGTQISAERALELGLIDEILDPAQAVAACLKKSFSHPKDTKTQNKETPPMAAEPTTTVSPSAECGGTPQKNEEEVVEVEKEVKETTGDDDKEKRITELEKKVEELSALVAEKQAKLDAQAKFRSVVAASANTAAEASLDWPELVKKHGFKKAAEQFPEARKAYMKAQIAKGSIR